VRKRPGVDQRCLDAVIGAQRRDEREPVVGGGLAGAMSVVMVPVAVGGTCSVSARRAFGKSPKELPKIDPFRMFSRLSRIGAAHRAAATPMGVVQWA
jgi:hypothetical protein